MLVSGLGLLVFTWITAVLVLPFLVVALGEMGAPSSLSKAAQGSLLSSLAYSRAVEAVVTAAKRGVGKEHGSEWRDATVRLLQSRSNSPLALLWAFLAFQKESLVVEKGSESGNLGSVGSLVSGARSLLHSLKLVTAGSCSGPTAIAAAAPIVQIVVHALAAFTGSEKEAVVSQKKKEKLWKSLQKVILELSGFITLCHHKDAPVVNGLFKAPSVNIGLDIWLSESADFASLFPFATQLKVDGFLNSAESVLYMGEVVETEAALLRLVAEVVQGRSSASVSQKDELEKKLKHDVVVYAKFLGSSTVILDMVLEAPLQLGGILADSEEVAMRDVLGEMAVVGVANSGVFDEDGGGLSARDGAGDGGGKESVAFLKRVMIARQLAAELRSRREYLRASDLVAGLHRRGAPWELGEWLGERGSLRVLISTAVLQKPQDLVDWLVNASKGDFDVVLDKAYIERPRTDKVEDVAAASMDMEEAAGGDEPLFFIDTSKRYHKDGAEGGFDADEEFVTAAGNIQADTMEDVLFDRSEQLERKRTRGAAKSKAAKAKQRKSADGWKGGEEASDSEEMSEDDSEEESSMISTFECHAEHFSATEATRHNSPQAESPHRGKWETNNK